MLDLLFTYVACQKRVTAPFYGYTPLTSSVSHMIVRVILTEFLLKNNSKGNSLTADCPFHMQWACEYHSRYFIKFLKGENIILWSVKIHTNSTYTAVTD